MRFTDIPGLFEVELSQFKTDVIQELGSEFEALIRSNEYDQSEKFARFSSYLSLLRRSSVSCVFANPKPKNNYDTEMPIPSLRPQFVDIPADYQSSKIKQVIIDIRCMCETGLRFQRIGF